LELEALVGSHFHQLRQGLARSGSAEMFATLVGINVSIYKEGVVEGLQVVRFMPGKATVDLGR